MLGHCLLYTESEREGNNTIEEWNVQNFVNEWR
jgi:hypothetical protein